MTQLRRLKVRVTVKGNRISSSMERMLHISAPYLLKLLKDYNYTLIRCSAQSEGVQNIAQSCKLKAKVKVEGNGIEH